MQPGRRKLLIGGGAAVGLAALGGWRAHRRLHAAGSRRCFPSPVADVPAAEPGTALDFFVIGDSGQDTDVRKGVVANMSRLSERAKPSFVITTGDNVYPHGVESVEDPAWRVHFEDAFDAPGLDLPFFPSLGNHDHEGDAAIQVEYSDVSPRWKLPAPYHSFSRAVGDGSAEYFVLDTTPLRNTAVPLGEPDQIGWLDRALSESTADWKIAVGHHPLYSGGTNGGSSKLSWYLSELFARHGVDLYFSGHNHDLELIDPERGWLQVVSGAGSAPRAVGPTDGTLFHAEGGGFTWVSLRRTEAWVQFLGEEEAPLATFHIGRTPSS